MKISRLLAVLSALTMMAVSSIPTLSLATAVPITLEKNSPIIKAYLEGYRLVDDKGVLETYALYSDRDYYQVYIKEDFTFNYMKIYVVSVSEENKKVYFVPLEIMGNDLLTMYNFHHCNYATIDEGVEAIQSYIDENNLDCTVVENICLDEYEDEFSWLVYGYKVVPNAETTFEGYIDLAKQLKDGLGLIPYVTGMQSSFTIELESTIAGDVNLDGTVDIADVVAISAYTGDAENNSFKSEQQIINGDVHNTGDGLTANDALMIQQYLAGMIDSLE
ncbi:MAG: dockerin type I repeat-containing protein [Oscillospiraceae bacterium]|nr:dockerin type I repeat-containing protein [Oscillospiraceae bacterium]